MGAGHNGVVYTIKALGRSTNSLAEKNAPLKCFISLLYIMPAKEITITVYSTPDCVKCKFLKDILTSKWLEFESKDTFECKDELKDVNITKVPAIKYTSDDVQTWFEDIETFIKYLEDNGIWK